MHSHHSTLDRRQKNSAGELVEIACYGGVGRTGTILSCLALCAGVQRRNAVGWVREHYNQRAVETDE